MRSLTTTILLAALTTTPALAGGGATFQVFDPPFFARGVSADGSVVFGTAITAQSARRAAIWTSGGGVEALPVPMSDGQPENAAQGLTAQSTSADGSVIVGSYSVAGFVRAFQWTSSSSSRRLFDPLLQLPPCLLVSPYPSMAFSPLVSDSGALIVGTGDLDSSPSFDQEVFTLQGCNLTQLESMEGIWDHSIARDVSADGSVIVGSFDSNAMALGVAVDGLLDVSATAECVSANGTVIAGWKQFPVEGRIACRWVAGGPAEPLGTLAFGPGSFNTALDVNADGTVIVGKSDSGNNAPSAFVWTPEAGMLSLQDVLEDEFGIDFGDRLLGEAQSISAAGDIIVGTGASASEGSFTWRITLPYIPIPCPADLNGDNAVNSTDLAQLLAAWGTPAVDLNNDATTDASDLAILLAAWGDCPS